MRPRLHYKCLDCGHVFPAEDAAQRDAEFGDCCPLWASIDICPECFSDQLQELQRCEICGNPVHDEQSDFCMDCQFIIDAAFQGAIESAARHLNWEDLGNKNDLIRLMFDRAEERHLYQEEGKTNG